MNKMINLGNATSSPVQGPQPPLSLKDIEAELASFKTQEKERLGIIDTVVDHWFDANPQRFTKSDRASTTLLFGGLTAAQDFLVEGALRGLGYKMEALEVPNAESLRFGKEFGNRGQCNPTYFTVGNLIKYLIKLQQSGMSRSDIIGNYAFFTAGSCGPCRFGMYITEYRKALHDAGFDGFRVLIFKEDGGLIQASGEDSGLELSPKFFITCLKALAIGDILNILGYRMRPYETIAGSTDAAIQECKQLIHNAFLMRGSLVRALRKGRKILRNVEISWLQPKPKVSIIGEFWAMTTEGEGNYFLQRFLEKEGAEVDIQPVIAWLLYQIWECRWDTRSRMNLRQHDFDKRGLGGVNVRKRLFMVWLAERLLRGGFQFYSRMLGLKNYKLTDMDEIATISHQHYDNHLRGGEGHMEVGKLIQTATRRKAHMVISVKPFGCMPSSGISDGVQSLVADRYPEAIFCNVETTGDAAVNMHSRVQMLLFKARQNAVKEYKELLGVAGLDQPHAEKRLSRSRRNRGTSYPGVEGVAGTAARFVSEFSMRWRASYRFHG